MYNSEFKEFLCTTDEWIYSHTGIRQRRIAAPAEKTVDLATKASLNALATAQLEPKDIDQIIVATSSPDYVGFPSVACSLQKALAIPPPCSAYDVAAACSGFVYALVNAINALAANTAQTILVVGAEKMSGLLDWHDRATSILFGDGAGAMIIGKAGLENDQEMSSKSASVPSSQVLSQYLFSNPEYLDVLSIVPKTSSVPYGGTNQYAINMNGRKVYNYAIQSVTESIEILCEKAALRPADLDLIIPHQANIRIIKSVAKKLSLAPERFFTNIDKYANTSAASIPIALSESIAQGRLKSGMRVAIIGFGAGFTTGGIILRW